MAQVTKSELVRQVEYLTQENLRLNSELTVLERVNKELLEALKAPKVVMPTAEHPVSGGGFAAAAARALANAEEDEDTTEPKEPAKLSPEWLVTLPNMSQKSEAA